MRLSLPVVNVKDIAESHLCCGCGVCAYLDPTQVQMVDDLEQGRRPFIRGTPKSTPAHDAAFAACPGRHLNHDYDAHHPELIQELRDAWGPILGVWEGHASEPLIRFAGSSGGAATALAAFAIEQRGFAGTLHIAARKDAPLLNATVFSTTREELLERTGSRYAPASPCDRLDIIEDATGPCVFIGKPCDVAAAHKARRARPRLDSNLGITISIFCAGTPSTRGTMQVLKAMGIEDPAEIQSIRYRGNGWPGMFSAEISTNERSRTCEMTYERSWGEILQKHRQWRCYICPDHTGEFADIAVGDPWHTPPSDSDPGRSLIVARTQRGKDFIEAAISSGALQAVPSSPSALVHSQLNVLRTRSVTFARLVALRALGAAVPSYKGFFLFRNWRRRTTLVEKLREFASTAVRVYRKGLNKRVPIQPTESPTSRTDLNVKRHTSTAVQPNG